MEVESRIQDIAQEVAMSDLRSVTVGRQGSVTSAKDSGTTGKLVESESNASSEAVEITKELSAEMLDVHNAVDKLNKIAESQMKDVSFSVDEDADATVIKVFKKETGELIKQFPVEMILAMKARIRNDTGWFYDSRI